MQTVTRLLPISLLLICPLVAKAQTISPECAPAQEQLKSAELAATQNDWAGAATRYQSADEFAEALAPEVSASAPRDLSVLIHALFGPELRPVNGINGAGGGRISGVRRSVPRV